MSPCKWHRHFDVCFKAKLPNITSSVTFATSPPPEAIDKDNTQLPFTGTSGQITVGGTTNTTDLVLKVGSATGATNSDVCLELTATNFKKVIGMQYVIKFDPAFLTHKSYDNLNAGLRGFSMGSLNANNTTGTIFL
ncbi:MAG: hypothetical protein IPO07_23770 [Haliscomenobacter sp.]|nr:cohesin domain-containing protein [Haliscomenobacter sp.]MBK9491465.1 hypothetical protein [Haliscomenobacter sp.]